MWGRPEWRGAVEAGEDGGVACRWGAGRVVSRAPFSPDLQDMSPMVLSCDGPDSLFDSHKLVLSVPFSDSKRVGVFCARGEWPAGLLSPLSCSPSASQTLSSLVHIPPPLQHLLYLPLPLTSSRPGSSQHATQGGGSKTSPTLERRPLRLRLRNPPSLSHTTNTGWSGHSNPGLLSAQTPPLCTAVPLLWSGSLGRALQARPALSRLGAVGTGTSKAVAQAGP